MDWANPELLEQMRTRQADVCLVAMPFGSHVLPSIALGILKAEAEAAGIPTCVEYAEFLLKELVGPADFATLISAGGVMPCVAESVFQPYVGYTKTRPREDLFRDFRDSANEDEAASVRRLEAVLAKGEGWIDVLLDRMCDRVLAHRPRLVGCSVKFHQLNASLALLRRLKERDPGLRTVLGGAVCTPSAAPAILSVGDLVDYLFVGETDDLFADALRLMLDGRDEELARRYPCVATHNRPHATYHAMADMDQVPAPDYDEFFIEAAHAGGKGRQDLGTIVSVEGSRGCWWGAKRACSFCVYAHHKDMASYRMKDPARFAAELDYLHDRYGATHFALTDNILHQHQVDAWAVLLHDKGYTLYAEVKANQTRKSLAEMRQAGIGTIQPGIESLADGALELMGKGCRTIKNVELLKNAREAGLNVIWNIMRGQPGEDPQWYQDMARLIPALHHLQAPSANDLVYQRNSLYTMHAEEYGIELEPAPIYRYVFEDDEDFARAVTDHYVRVDGHDTGYFGDFDRAVREWDAAWRKGRERLTYFDAPGETLIVRDTRGCARGDGRHELAGIERDLCLACDQVASEHQLRERFGDRWAEAESALEGLVRSRLLIRIGDDYLFLALPSRWQKLASSL